MMEGTYYKEWSAVLDREMEFKVYGHGGVPVLALPARGGRFYDWENNGMPDAAARLLHEGRIQLFCADSIDGESLLAGNESPRRRAEMQEKYFVYLTSELAARIAELNAPERKEKPLIWCVGVDTGAYQAVQCRLRRPRTFAGAMGLSGLFAGFNIVAAGYLGAVDRPAEASATSLSRGIVAIVACSLVLSALFGMNGVWAAFPASEAITACLTLFLLKRKN